MFRLCLFAFSFVLLGALVESIDEGPTPRIQLIGVYNGHSFFYDKTAMTRANAKAYCASQGLKLAEISSLNNLRMFQNYHESDTAFLYTDHYWLAGVDSKRPTQFIWEDTKNEMDTELLWTGFNGPNTCVTYYFKGLYSYPCATSAYVICQS